MSPNRKGNTRASYDSALPLRTTFAGQKFFSRSHDGVIRVYDAVGNVIETHEHKGDFKEW